MTMMGINRKHLFTSIGMMVAGWLIIFLITITVIPTSYFLCFFAYIIFLIGFVMGSYLVISQIILEKRLREQKNKYKKNPKHPFEDEKDNPEGNW